MTANGPDKPVHFTVNGNSFTNAGGLQALIRFSRAADELGYDHLRLIDHVVGFVAERHPEVAPTPYVHTSQFQEVFTLMAHLSAITQRIGFVTGVLGLPQRQTALVAKQAAQVDVMSGGRLILGVGVGYNSVEFGAMGASFGDRGERIEEQIQVLRALWTEEVVTFHGKWHDLADVNINPLPVQRPIPIWMGAGRTANPVPPEKVMTRIGRSADGFMPLFRIDDKTGRLNDEALACLETVRRAAETAGRDPSLMKLEISLFPDGKSADRILHEIAYLRGIGTTHVHLRLPDTPVEQQIDQLGAFAQIRDRYLKTVP